MWKLSRGYEDLPEPPERKQTVVDKDNTKWVTADGKELEVKDMTSNHIQNCISMMDRMLKPRKVNPTEYKIYNILKDELKRRHGQIIH